MGSALPAFQLFSDALSCILRGLFFSASDFFFSVNKYTSTNILAKKLSTLKTAALLVLTFSLFTFEASCKRSQLIWMFPKEVR